MLKEDRRTFNVLKASAMVILAKSTALPESPTGAAVAASTSALPALHETFKADARAQWCVPSCLSYEEVMSTTRKLHMFSGVTSLPALPVALTRTQHL